MGKTAEEIFAVLCEDKEFVSKIENTIKEIMRDNKIDYNDIPEFIFIITQTYNTLGKFELTTEEFPVLIRLTYKMIADKLNIIPENKKEEFERMVESAIKLVMLKPFIKKKTNAILGTMSSLISCFRNK